MVDDDFLTGKFLDDGAHISQLCPGRCVEDNENICPLDFLFCPKIAQFDERDRAMAERLHAIIKATAPELSSRTWYGSPAYYRDGDLICFFQERAKFKSRYATLGFSDKAHLDDGAVWPVVYALMELTPADEERIAVLVKKALG